MLRALPVLLLLTLPALAETRQPSAAQQAQQERMRSCNAEAKARGLSGDARRPFMSDCLKGAAPPAGTQRN